MDIMSGDSDLSGSSGENDIYEEDEVVWCKIRGYPWWPGYVNLLTIRLANSYKINKMRLNIKFTSSVTIPSIVFS